MKYVSVLVAIGVFVFLPALHGETIVFGPQLFALATQEPQTFDVQIPIDTGASCSGKATYVLVIVTGDAPHAITSGTVAINGVTILGPSDFNNASLTVEQQFKPLALNLLHVAIAGGKPGATMSVSVKRLIEETIFDKTYTLSAKSDDFRDAFATTSPGVGYVLLVQSAPGNGTQAPRQFAVQVNGVQVAAGLPVTSGLISRIPIVLQSQNSLAISMNGSAGNAVALAVHRAQDESACTNLAIAISSPHDGDTVSTHPLFVRGTAVGPPDIGVTVNGAIAQVDLTHGGTTADPFHWVATENAVDGPLTILATAAAQNARPVTAEINVSLSPAGANVVDVFAVPQSGVAPFDTAFVITAKLEHRATLVEYDFNGDGVYDLAVPSTSQDVPYHFEHPGLYEVGVRITDTTDSVWLSSVPVQVDSLVTIDRLLQARWQAFTSALAAGNIEVALSLMAGDAERGKYRPALNLIRPTIAQFAADIAGLHLVYIRGNTAHYILTRVVNGATRGYPVYFVRGSDGVWALAQF